MAIWPFGTPNFANISTEILFTRKYGIPSKKYKVGTHNHGDTDPLPFADSADPLTFLSIH